MPIITSLVGSKVALAALALAALGGGGAVVAATAANLPTAAHATPAPTDTTAPDPMPGPSQGSGSDASSNAVGPDASGPAGFGLCTAALAGGLTTDSPASRALVAAAGDTDVDEFCELVVSIDRTARHDDYPPQNTGQHGAPEDPGSVTAPELPGAADHGISHRPSEHPGH